MSKPNRTRLVIEVSPDQMDGLRALPITMSRVIRWAIDAILADPVGAMRAASAGTTAWPTTSTTTPTPTSTPAWTPRPYNRASKAPAGPAQPAQAPAQAHPQAHPQAHAQPQAQARPSANLDGGLPPAGFVPPTPRHQDAFLGMDWRVDGDNVSVAVDPLVQWLGLPLPVADALATPDADRRVDWDGASNLMFEAAERQTRPAEDRVALTDWLVAHGYLKLD
jgi:hypothetical protein